MGLVGSASLLSHFSSEERTPNPLWMFWRRAHSVAHWKNQTTFSWTSSHSLGTIQNIRSQHLFQLCELNILFYFLRSYVNWKFSVTSFLPSSVSFSGCIFPCTLYSWSLFRKGILCKCSSYFFASFLQYWYMKCLVIL